MTDINSLVEELKQKLLRKKHGMFLNYFVKKYGKDNKLSIPLNELYSKEFFGTYSLTKNGIINIYRFDDEEKMDKFIEENDSSDDEDFQHFAKFLKGLCS